MISQRARRIVLVAFAAIALLSSVAASFAQPAPVPALPDTERRTSYSLTASTCACTVNMALYGDSTDYQNWIEVWLNGIRVNYNDAFYGWTITSPSGQLGRLALPITNAVLTFNNPQTGTVQIVGARRPRRVSQFNENQGVAARDLNQALTDIVAQNRETWDKINDVTGRALLSQPGNILGILPIPSLCQGAYLAFDATGLNPVCVSSAVAPSGFVAGNGIVFSGTNPVTISAPGNTTCLNILAYGGSGNGTTANDTAFANAWAALPSSGGCIYFPPGRFMFAAQIAPTFPNATFSISLFGQGSGATSLYFPNASNGINFTKANANTSVHIRDMTLITGQASVANGITLYGVGHNLPYGVQSDITNVQLQGSDFAPNTGSNCWANAVFIHDWSAVLISNVNTFGTWSTPGTAGCGVGLFVEGDAASTDYAINISVISSAFNYHTSGIELAGYWQGFSCIVCNINGTEGTTGINVPASAPGTLAGFWMTGSEISSGGYPIFFGSDVSAVSIVGNDIGVFTPSSVALVFNGFQFSISGNTFSGVSSAIGVLVQGSSAVGTVTGNTFATFNTGINLGSSTQLITGALNNYDSVTTKVTNSGSNNYVGNPSLAAGTMTGVAP